MSTEVYQVTHSSPQIKTLGDYVSQLDSPGWKFKDKEEDFLKIEGEINGVKVTNKSLIEKTYNKIELKDNENSSAKDKLLKTGTKLFIPVKDINLVGLLTEGLEVVSNDFPAFKAKQLLEIEADFGYQQTYTPLQGQYTRGVTKDLLPYFSVFIWCRALSNTFDVTGQEVEEMKGSLIDVTPFLQRIQTSVGKNGGNFSFTLPPLVCELEAITDSVSGKVNPKWVVKKNTTKKYDYGTVVDGNQQFVSEGHMFSEMKNTGLGETMRKSQFFFHNVISPNDLVFIRFEALQSEKKQRVPEELFELNEGSLAGNIYDMIGLVDSNPLDSNMGANDVSITVTGRDLMKLIIDDGCYFFSLENIAGQFRTAGESTRDGELMRRLISDKSSYFLSLYQNNTIERVLKFVVQQLSEISVVPNSLFTSWGDRRNQRYLEKNERNNNTLRADKILEKETDIKNRLQETFDNYKEDTYNEFYQFVSYVRTNKHTITPNTISGGWNAFTYGGEQLAKNAWPMSFYTKEIIDIEELGSSEVFKYCLEVEEVIKLQESKPKNDDENRDHEKTLARGIWQIVKLVIDQGVTDRVIVDSSLSTANGSLVNFFRKVCQEPFVEFTSDTYGDCFYFLVRKPPIDRKSILSLLKSPVRTVDPRTQKEEEFNSSVITIMPEDVIREELSFTDQEAYSWYNFKPQNLMVGGNTTIQTVYTPAIFLEEYAKIWGSKPLEIVHNYNPYYQEYNKDTGVPDVSRYETQAITDLKFLIEGHAYLPFVRSGELVLNGDRRIKRGNLIRYAPTGEIFHVDSVSQLGSISDSTIDRVTSVQVSRGMVESLIYGVTINGHKVSYFDIVNTDFKVEKKFYPPQTVTEKVVKQTLNPLYEEAPLKPSPTAATGPGQVLFRVEADRPRMNKALLKDLQKAAEISGLSFMVTTAITGHSKYTKSGDISRHGAGTAVDIAIINGMAYGLNITKFTALANKLTAVFESMGYVRDREKGNTKAVLFGFNSKSMGNHLNHLHVSNKSNAASDVTQQYAANGQPKYTESTEDVSRTIPGYWGLDTEKIYQNLKVNKYVFNFFLRREQLNFDTAATNQQITEQSLNVNSLKNTTIKQKK